MALAHITREEDGDVVEETAALMLGLNLTEPLELGRDLVLLLLVKLAVVHHERGVVNEERVELYSVLEHHLGWWVGTSGGWHLLGGVDLGRGARLEEDVACPRHNNLIVGVREGADTGNHGSVAATGVNLPFGVNALHRRGSVFRLELWGNRRRQGAERVGLGETDNFDGQVVKDVDDTSRERHALGAVCGLETRHLLANVLQACRDRRGRVGVHRVHGEEMAGPARLVLG